MTHLAGARSRKFPRLLEFTELASALFAAGLPARDALVAISCSAEREEVRVFSSMLFGGLDKGKSFHAALEDSGYGLPPIYLALIRLGERTGGLELIFPLLCKRLKTGKKAREKLAGAIVYPATVLAVAVLGIVGLSVFLLPRLTSIFEELGGSGGDVAGRIAVLNVAGIVVLALLAAAAAGIAIAAAAARRDPEFALARDAAVLRLPVIGRMIVNRETFSLAFAVEVLCKSGMPLDAAIETAAGALGNAAAAADAPRLQDALRRGVPMAEACAAAKVLPGYFTQWLAVGDRTGQIDQVFGQVRLFYEEIVDRDADRVLSLAEPAITLLVGVCMLGLVVFVIVPLFSAYGSLLGG